MWLSLHSFQKFLLPQPPSCVMLTDKQLTIVAKNLETLQVCLHPQKQAEEAQLAEDFVSSPSPVAAHA